MNITAQKSLLECSESVNKIIYQLRLGKNVSRDQIMHALDAFVAMARKNLYSESIIEKAHYLFCAGLDEAYVNANKNKHQAPLGLCLHYHQKSNAGEDFFEKVEHYLHRRDEYQELLKIIFYIISTGYRGQYALYPDGLESLLKKRQQIASAVNWSSVSEQSLQRNFLDNRPLIFLKKRLVSKLLVASILLLLVSYFSSSYFLDHQLQKISVKSNQVQTLTGHLVGG